MYKTEVYRLHINMCILARPGLDYTEQGIPTLASPPLIAFLSLSLSLSPDPLSYQSPFQPSSCLHRCTDCISHL